MDKTTAITTLSALAQTTRLEVFRLLVRAGHEGCSAGEIAETLSIRQNTMSVHLGILARTPLVSNKRVGRSIFYYANFAGIRALMTYLMEDCCAGNEEICAPVLESLCCEPGKNSKR